MNEESSKIYLSLQTEGKIIKSVGGSDIFFMEKARNSLKIAKRLEEIQEKNMGTGEQKCSLTFSFWQSLAYGLAKWGLVMAWTQSICVMK